jgi:hypothetical protein
MLLGRKHLDSVGFIPCIHPDWINTHGTLDSAAETINSNRKKNQTGLVMVAAIDSAPNHTNHR